MSKEKPGAEEGFGLIEIVVSLFLLALIAVALLPLLVQGIRVSAMNATLASATQLVHDQIEHARGQTTCDDVIALQGSVTTAADARGKQFDVAVDTDDVCSAVYPGVVKLRVTVADHRDPSETLAEATTLILPEPEG